MTAKICADESCNEAALAREMCRLHYERWASPYRKAGLPLPPRQKVVKERAECSIEGCEKKVLGRGWCSMHYWRWQNYGDPEHLPARRNTCTVEGCDKFVTGLGLCRKHYDRKRSNGDPLVVQYVRGDDPARFESHVDRSAGPDACHPWTGSIDRGGYGAFKFKGKSTKAHIAAWELENGPKPPGSEIDHECHNQAVRDGTCSPGICTHRACCNPAHLVARSRKEHRDSTQQWQMPQGSANATAKLTEAQVQEIRGLLAANVMSQRRIAQLYELSPSTVGRIRTGQVWGWLPPT